MPSALKTRAPPPCVAARPIAASPTQNLGPRWRTLGTAGSLPESAKVFYGTGFDVFVKCSRPLRTRAEMTLPQQQSKRPGAQPANTWMNWSWLWSEAQVEQFRLGRPLHLARLVGETQA